MTTSSRSDDDKLELRTASAQEIEESLCFALRFAGRKRVHHADEVMARITAERLAQHLERSGYVLMKKQPPECRLISACPATSSYRSGSPGHTRGRPRSGCAWS